MQKNADFDSVGSRPIDPTKYNPIGLRRTPDEDEAAYIKARKASLFPDLFQDPDDPIASDIASPTKGAILYGALAGLVGAAAGKGVSKLTGLDEKKSMLTGGASLAALAAMAAYLSRRRKNHELEDLALRLPARATRRDVDMNPILAMGEDPEYVTQIARVNAALKGRGISSKNQ